MNKTLVRNILRMIKATKSRFFSLTAIVALGVAFFIGVYSSSTVMDHSVDLYVDAVNLKDLTIYSNYGFREEDVQALESLDCIEKAEGSYFVDVLASSGSGSAVTRVHSYNEDNVINQFVLKEGRLPENEHEALSESGTTITRGFSIGKTVSLTRPNEDLDSFMTVDEVTIVGMIDTPVYMNMTKENSTLSNRPIRTYLYVPESAFCSDYYLEVNALAKGAKELDTFRDPYYVLMDGVTDEVKDFALSQQKENFLAIKQEALEKYNDGLREYRDGEEEFRKEIADGEQKLLDGEKELEDGRKTLEDSIAQLNDGQKELDEQEASARKQIADGWAQLKDGLKQLDDGIGQLSDLKKTRQDVMDGQKTIDEGREALVKAKALLELVPEDMKMSEVLELAGEDPALRDALKQLDPDAESKTVGELRGSLESASAQLEEAQVQVNDGLKQIDEGIQDFGTKEENASMLKDKEEASSLREELDPLYEDLAVLEMMQKVIPEGYDDVNIELLVRYRNEIFDLLDRIPFDRIDGVDTAGDLLERAQETVQEALERAEDEETIARLEEVQERLVQVKEEVPASILEMDLEFFTVYGRQILRVIEELNLGEGQEIRTLGDLRLAVNGKQEGIRASVEEKKRTRDAADADGQKIAETILDRKVQELTEQREEVAANEKTLKDSEATLEKMLADGRKQLADGWEQVEQGRKDLEAGEAELEDGRAELEKGRTEGEEKLAEAWEELQDAKKTIDDLADGEWTVLNRKLHYATATYDATIDQMAAIGRIFPFFFLMVAILVCLTTMARTVDEQRGEIGVLRALGYSRLQCAGKYLIYSAAATLLGEFIGVIAGMATFPLVIYNTWRMMYILPSIHIAVQWDLVALTAFAFLAVMLATTWFACSKDMNEVPAQLLRPKSPKLGRNMFLEKITFLWSRISFTWKVTIRNIVRYKGRFFMTVGGVAGCTALLITGFGIKDSIRNMVEYHFNQIVQYDGVVAVKDDLTVRETEELREELEERDDISLSMLFYSFNSDAYGNAETSDSVRIQVFEQPEDVNNCYVLRTRKGHHPVELTNEGAVINEKLAERAQVSIGDTMEVTDEEGRRHAIKVAGITEMYIQHYVFMTLDYYEETCGEVPLSRSIALRSNDPEHLHDLQKDLAEHPQCAGLEFYDSTLERFDTMAKSLDLIVWTIIIASMALAFVVLGNLINVNISERQREIATLKVLGFRRKEVQSYIYKENNILTFFGALAGIPLGIWLHSTIMLTVEMDYVMFGRSVTLSSVLISVGLTVLFGVLVNYSMRNRLHSIQMVESLKSVE